MFIRKDVKPWKTICGCPLYVGVIIYAVLVVVQIILNIIGGSVGAIISNLIYNSPIICLAARRNNFGMRNCMACWVIIQFVVYCIFLVILLFITLIFGAILFAADCDNLDGGAKTDCEDDKSAILTWVYIFWACLLFIGIPVNLFWIALFRAFADQLKYNDSTPVNTTTNSVDGQIKPQ